MTNRKEFKHFLQVLDEVHEEVPASGTEEWETWTFDCKSLGEEAVVVLVEMLRDGTPEQQYAALLALRQHGHKAWGHGYGKGLYYTVELKIRPRIA